MLKLYKRRRLSFLIRVIMVLLTTVLNTAGASNSTRRARSPAPRLHDAPTHWAEEEGVRRGGRREMLAVLRREGGAGPVDCCPAVLEMVEPEAGRNQRDNFVELYRDGDNKQRFYELSCRPDVENKPCRFVDRRLHNQSRCVQKYSYTYALVRDTGAGDGHRRRHPARHFPALPGAGGWMLDYIRVRSGCSCEVEARPKRPAPARAKRPRARRPALDDT